VSEHWTSRRRFLRGMALLAAAPFGVAFYSLTGRLAALKNQPRRVAIPADLRNDVTFLGEVIVCRTGDGVRVLSARCTHLGCRVDQQVDGLLVCPCHGSRFRYDGTVASGPAAGALATLPQQVDPKTGTTSVVLPRA
jgi:Rieske Fe-S protein